MAHLALMVLATMTLAFTADCRAEDAAAVKEPVAAGPAALAPDAASDAAPPPAVVHRAGRHGPVRRLTIAQSIDESVQRLTRGLDLDQGQQDRVRQILVYQHRQVMQLRNGGSASSGEVTGAMLSIYDDTRARIRTILTDEQRKKYPATVPRDQTAPAQGDLKHWMELQETKRKQNGGASQ